jgi:FkbM family methyltransferase
MTLRQILMPVFRRFNPGDIRIRHHYTPHTLALHSFTHRGYWFHGRRREESTIQRLRALVKPGDCVVDVGGHIGYFTLLFSHLVGPSGRVLVFEPSPTNLPYLYRNVDKIPNVTVKEIALCDYNGTAELFVEDLTGQNCTLVPDYAVAKANIDAAGLTPALTTVLVKCATLDQAIEAETLSGKPTLIKIDAEGEEFEILEGMSKTLSAPDLVLMVEISRRHEEVGALLHRHGFSAFSPDGEQLATPARQGLRNVFFVKGRGLSLLRGSSG